MSLKYRLYSQETGFKELKIKILVLAIWTYSFSRIAVCCIVIKLRVPTVRDSADLKNTLSHAPGYKYSVLSIYSLRQHYEPTISHSYILEQLSFEAPHE